MEKNTPIVLYGQNRVIILILGASRALHKADIINRYFLKYRDLTPILLRDQFTSFSQTTTKLGDNISS